MPKTVDVPQELRAFNSIFEKIAYRHECSRVFNDFLDFTIKGFSPIGDFEELNKYGQSQYELNERHLFFQLMQEWIKVMNIKISDDKDYYDAFGTFYEILASSSKKSAFGQFFTPGHICEVMGLIVGNDNKGEIINEPCCGSGRFIISYHVHHLGNYYFAEDLDPVCCKMTALNMLIHGCVGVVINHDSLLKNDFRNAWVINESLNFNSIPTIRNITQNEIGFFYRIWNPNGNDILKKVEDTNIEPSNDILSPSPIKFETANQLSLF